MGWVRMRLASRSDVRVNAREDSFSRLSCREPVLYGAAFRRDLETLQFIRSRQNMLLTARLHQRRVGESPIAL